MRTYLWLVSAALAYWAALFVQWFAPIHEFGHMVSGIGMIVDWNHTQVWFDWYGARIGGTAVPMLLYAFLGRKYDHIFPKNWAFGAIIGQLLDGREQMGDYPYRSPPHMAGIWVFFAISTLWLVAPKGWTAWRTGRFSTEIRKQTHTLPGLTR